MVRPTSAVYVAGNYSAVRDEPDFTSEEFRVVAEHSFKVSSLGKGEKKNC
jgi:hypothetical protein